MARYRAQLDADNMRSETYRDAETPSDAADAAIRGWRSDAVQHGEGAGDDLYGPYLEFAYRAGKRFASVKIRES